MYSLLRIDSICMSFLAIFLLVLCMGVKCHAVDAAGGANNLLRHAGMYARLPGEPEI
jgi:hypothetical protein